MTNIKEQVTRTKRLLDIAEALVDRANDLGIDGEEELRTIVVSVSNAQFYMANAVKPYFDMIEVCRTCLLHTDDCECEGGPT